MTTEIATHRRSPSTMEGNGFWLLVHAEWTKFRTVRGWVTAVLITIVAIGAFVFVAVSGGRSCVGTGGASACPAQPIGPGGEPVVDAFYFAHQQVTGNGAITAQVTSLTGQIILGQGGNGQFQMAPRGLDPWSKAGIIIKENTAQGSAYAAMMITGSNGVRMQWNYVNDTPGLTGSVSASRPRWLRLVRHGDTITGYDSADGTHWTLVGTATVPWLTATVQVGLFAAGSSDNSNFATLATGTFRHVGLSWPATGWAGTNVGGANSGVPVPGTLRQSDGALAVASFGDISPAAGNAYGGSGQPLQRALAGTFFGLIPLIVVAAMFITAEYRRGLIRVSLAAVPRRGRLLAAKAVVIGAVGFVAGLVAAIVALGVGMPLLRRAGGLDWPVSLLTEARIVVGTAALLAVAAVLALAIGAIVRRSAPAIAIVIVVVFVPYLLASDVVQPQGSGPPAAGWELRITPAAALSVQQAAPRFHQLIAAYSPNAGYYPLSPWAGLAVEGAWAAAALALGYYQLRRRDA